MATGHPLLSELVLTVHIRVGDLFRNASELVEESIGTRGTAGVDIAAEELFDLSPRKVNREAEPDFG